MTSNYAPIKGYKANIRQIDDKVLGVVTDRYKVVQNVVNRQEEVKTPT
jgi:hypothetical protein